MEKGLEEIQADIHNIEEDVKKKNCSAVYDLIDVHMFLRWREEARERGS